MCNPSILLSVWHRLFKFILWNFFLKSVSYQRRMTGYPSILLLVWQQIRTLGTFLHTAAQMCQISPWFPLFMFRISSLRLFNLLRLKEISKKMEFSHLFQYWLRKPQRLTFFPKSMVHFQKVWPTLFENELVFLSLVNFRFWRKNEPLWLP